MSDVAGSGAQSLAEAVDAQDAGDHRRAPASSSSAVRASADTA